MKIEPTNTLPSEISQEFMDRYQVREVAPAPSPSPSVLFAQTPTPPPSEDAPKEKIAGKGKAAKLKSKKKAKTPPIVPVQKIQPVGAGERPSGAAVSKFPMRRPKVDPIWVGEKQHYEITYFGVPAGDLVVEVLPHKTINGRKVYHLHGHATSRAFWSVFYRINDTIDSFVDYDGVFSHRFHMKLDETRQQRDALEIYDHEKKEAFYWNRWDHKTRGYSEQKEFYPIDAMSQDSLSALMYLRMIPLPDGSTTVFPVISEGKTWDAVATVVRRETIDTPLGKMNTVVIKPQTRFRGMLQQQGNQDSYIWLTDDEKKFIVRFEAKVRIGTVIAQLLKVEPGTKEEQTP